MDEETVIRAIATRTIFSTEDVRYACWILRDIKVPLEKWEGIIEGACRTGFPWDVLFSAYELSKTLML
jgi:hypothetical protein